MTVLPAICAAIAATFCAMQGRYGDLAFFAGFAIAWTTHNLCHTMSAGAGTPPRPRPAGRPHPSTAGWRAERDPAVGVGKRPRPGPELALTGDELVAEHTGDTRWMRNHRPR